MKTKIDNLWKKILIAALCVLAVAALVFACLLANVYYDKYHKSYYWENLARDQSPKTSLWFMDMREKKGSYD